MNAHEASNFILNQAKKMSHQMILDGDLIRAISLSDLEDICNYVGDEF